MRKRECYTSEFRQEAVKLALSSGKTITQIAVELGINMKTLSTWIQRAMKEQKTSRKAKQPAQHSNEKKDWR